MCTDSYIGLCAFLGISSPEDHRLYNTDVVQRDSDGFVWPKHRMAVNNLQEVLAEFGVDRSFTVSAIQSLADHINMHQNGMDFVKTHLGQILHGCQLKRDEDF
jgi:hypothetical protein